jgi:hypothetical protein
MLISITCILTTRKSIPLFEEEQDNRLLETDHHCVDFSYRRAPHRLNRPTDSRRHMHTDTLRLHRSYPVGASTGQSMRISIKPRRKVK